MLIGMLVVVALVAGTTAQPVGPASCPMELENKVFRLLYAMPNITSKKLYWLYTNFSLPDLWVTTPRPMYVKHELNQSLPSVGTGTGKAGLLDKPGNNGSVVRALAGEGVQPPSGLVSRCDLYTKLWDAINYLFNKCYPSAYTASSQIENVIAVMYYCTQGTITLAEFWCPLLGQPSQNAVVSCLSRRLLMVETFYCYLINEYSIFRDVRPDSFVLQHLNVTGREQYSSYLHLKAASCIATAGALDKYCGDQAQRLYLKAATTMYTKLMGTPVSPPVRSPREANMMIYTRQPETYLPIPSPNVNLIYCRNMTYLNETSWKCFGELWYNFPIFYDKGWYDEFPVNRRYLLQYVLKRDWFQATCHIVTSRVSPCTKVLENACGPYGYRNYMVEALRHLCSMSYHQLTEEVERVFKCNNEMDELSFCLASLFPPMDTLFLVSGGITGANLPIKLPDHLKALCWWYQRVSACVRDVYAWLGRRCGRHVSRTLQALRELLLVSSRTLIVTHYIANLLGMQTNFTDDVINMTKILQVRDPLTGDVVHQVCPHF